MSKEVAVLATVAAGGVVALQAPANNVLSKYLGSFGAAVASFSVGLIVIVVVTFAFAGGIKTDGTSPAWYYWILGGVGGVVIVTVSLIAVRELGAGGVTAATIAGAARPVGRDRPHGRARPRRAPDHLGEAAGDRAAGARDGADRQGVTRVRGAPGP